MSMVINGAPKKSTVKKTSIENQENNTFPFWLNLLFSFVIGIGSDILGILVTDFTLNPIAGEWASRIIEIGGEVLLDELTGYDDALTLSLDIISPTLRGISRTSRLLSKKQKRNPLLQISKNIDTPLTKDLDLLARDLQQIEKAGGIVSTAEKQRNYEKVLSKYANLNIKKESYLPESLVKMSGEERTQIRTRNKEILKKVNKTITYTNKAISMLDPQYATKSLVKFLTKPIKKKINKHMKKMTNAVLKHQRQVKFALAHSLIPLNHTDAPWITGIKLIDNKQTIGLYDVIIYFNPILTNNKPPIYLFYKKFDDFIKPFLDAPSAGQYYIDNISWGWDVGAFIRSNGWLIGANAVPYASQIISMVSKTKRTIEKTITITSPDYWKNWNQNIINDVTTGITEGLTTGLKIPGAKAVNAISKSLASKDSSYILNYGKTKVEKYITKSLRMKKNSQIYKKYYI